MLINVVVAWILDSHKVLQRLQNAVGQRAPWGGVFHSCFGKPCHVYRELHSPWPLTIENAVS